MAAKRVDLRHHLIERMFLAAIKGIGGVAPNAAKIAAGEPHENARQTGARAFALNGFEDFGDEHVAIVKQRAGLWLYVAADVSVSQTVTLRNSAQFGPVSCFELFRRE